MYRYVSTKNEAHMTIEDADKAWTLTAKDLKVSRFILETPIFLPRKKDGGHPEKRRAPNGFREAPLNPSKRKGKR